MDVGSARAGRQGAVERLRPVAEGAKYIDLTHVIAPNIPVWHGFGPSKFEPAEAATDIDGFARKGDAFTLREARRRSDPLRSRDRPARHAARSAGPLGARIPLDRRAAADLRRAPARRRLHRGQGRRTSWISPAGRRHRGFREEARDAFRRARSSSSAPTGRRPGPIPSSGHPQALPRRVARGAEVPAPAATHSPPWPRAARHRHDGDARGRGLAHAQRLHPGGRRRQPRRRAGDRAAW